MLRNNLLIRWLAYFSSPPLFLLLLFRVGGVNKIVLSPYIFFFLGGGEANFKIRALMVQRLAVLSSKKFIHICFTGVYGGFAHPVVQSPQTVPEHQHPAVQSTLHPDGHQHLINQEYKGFK